MIKFASAGNRGSLFLIGRGASEIYFNHSEALPTILVKTFGTLCVLGDENVIQGDPLPPPSPPSTVLGVTSQTPFTYLVHFMDLNFV